MHTLRRFTVGVLALGLLLVSAPGASRAQPINEPGGAVSDVRSDLELKRDVRNELVWDTRVDTTNVFVSVDGGVATLTGTVPTNAARQAAGATALKAGVAGVRNQLRVVP